MNARLSRSSALASKALGGRFMTALGTVPSCWGLKATGYPLAYVAAKIALGWESSVVGIDMEVSGWKMKVCTVQQA